MGILRKDAVKTTLISYIGLVFGYVNKGVLFILFFSTEQIGLVNLLLSVGLLFAQLSNLGFINTVWRFSPFFRNDTKGNYGFLKFSFKLVFLGCIIFSILSIVLRSEIVSLYSEKSILFVNYFYWIIPIGVANVFFLVAETFLRGLSQNTISVFVNEFIHRIFLTILLFLFGFKIISFELFIVLFALSYFIPTITLIAFLVKIRELKGFTKKSNISKKFQNILYSYSAFSYINSLGAIVVITMDTMMIASFLGLKETGVYSTILYLISALQIPNRSILRVGTSLVAKYWKEKNMLKMKDLYKKVSSISLLISLYLFLIIWINIIDLFSFLPNEYEAGIYTFLFFMIGKLVDIYMGLNGIIFITSKKYKYDIIFTTTLLIVVFVLNLYLIPKFGIVGAAISTSIALIIYNVGRMLFVWKWYNIHPFEKHQLYIVLLFLFILILFKLPLNLDFNKYINIIMNSLLITLIYFGTIIKLKWNQDLNKYIDNLIIKFKNISLNKVRKG